MAGHPTAAAGTRLQVDAGQREESLLPLLLWRTGLGRFVVGLQVTPGLCELRADVAARVQAVVANLDEAVGQNVEEKAPDEFRRGDGDLLAVLGAEADAALVEGNEPVVRDAHAVGVPAEILEDLLGSGERALGVDHPVLAVQRVLELVEAFGVRENRTRLLQLELAALVGIGESVEELAAE